MASSVNNWLGFSLSPQEHQDHHSIYNSDEISGTTDCYGLSTESLIPSLNLPPPFGYPAESFSRNNLQGLYYYYLIYLLRSSIDSISFCTIHLYENRSIYLCKIKILKLQKKSISKYGATIYTYNLKINCF